MATAEMSKSGRQFPWWLVLIEGILAIIVGFMFLVWPIKAFTTLVFFLGFWWLFDGIFDIVSIFLDRANWGWKLFMGIIGIIAGLFLIQAPLQGAVVLSSTTILLIGFMGMFYGILGLVNAFRGGGWGAGILGAVSIIMGLYLLFNVWSAALALPWLVGIFAIAGGIAAIVLAFRIK